MRPLTHIQSSHEERRPPPPAAPKRAKLSEEGLDGSFQPCAPAARVRIYTLEREWGFEYWLCPAGVAEMVARERWTIRKHRAPPFDDLPCYVHGRSCPA